MVVFTILSKSPRDCWVTCDLYVFGPRPLWFAYARLRVVLICRPTELGCEPGSTWRCPYAALFQFLWPSFGVRRASEIAALTTSDVVVDEAAGLAVLKIRCRKNDRLGFGHMAQVVALPARTGACPVRVLCGSEIGCRVVAAGMVVSPRLPSPRRCLSV